MADPNLQIRGARSSRHRDKGGPASKKIFWGPFGPQFGLKISGGLPSIRHCFNKGTPLMKRFCFYFFLPVFLLINYFIHYLLLKTLFSLPSNKKCLNELLYVTIFIILKMCMPCRAVRGECLNLLQTHHPSFPLVSCY